MDEDRVLPSWRGVLDHIHIASAASLPMEPLSECDVTVGVGIPGDRYATRTGRYADRHHIDRQITLIEIETLQALDRDRGIVVAPGDHRPPAPAIWAPNQFIAPDGLKSVGAQILGPAENGAGRHSAMTER